MSRIIAVVNHKGGVGKTTTTLNLGKALSLQGKKVLLIDLDPQANLSQSVGIEKPQRSIYEALEESSFLPIDQLSPTLSLSPSSLALSKAEMNLHTEPDGYFRLRSVLENVTDFDIILIDCPPSLGVLSSNALIAATDILIPVQSQFLATKGLETIEELVFKIKRNLNKTLSLLGILMTQTNRTVLSQSVKEMVGANYGDKVFKTFIRQNIALAEASVGQKDIFDYAPESHGAEDYKNLSSEILERL